LRSGLFWQKNTQHSLTRLAIISCIVAEHY